MDEKEGLNGSGVEPRVENPDPLLNFSGSIATLSPPPPADVAAAPPPTTEARKKRGRPRKYAGDGSVVALSPMPISASIPLTGDYSAWKQSSGKPVGSFKKKHKLESQNPGGMMAYLLGASFTPHVITVNTGEDIMMKIISFSQQGSRAICILAANGAISNVTLRHADSSGGTLTYEGRFEILSLTGSFMPNDNGLTKSRSGGMSVSLAGPDGRVLGGGLAGMLVAAGPVQVVIGSFLPTGHQLEQKPKKPKHEQTITFAPIPVNPVSEERYETTYHGPKPNLMTNSTPFQVHNLPSVNPVHGSNITGLDNNSILFSGEEDSREQSHDLAC